MQSLPAKSFVSYCRLVTVPSDRSAYSLVAVFAERQPVSDNNPSRTAGTWVKDLADTPWPAWTTCGRDQPNPAAISQIFGSCL